MQALARLVDHLRQRLEADGCIDQIAQDQARGLRLAVEKQARGLIQQRPGKGRIALHTLDYGLFEISGQCQTEDLGPVDIRLLPSFRAAAEQNDQTSFVPGQIDPVARPPIDAVFADVFKPRRP